MKFHYFCPPYENPWLHLKNSTVSPPLPGSQRLIDHGRTTVLWSGSTKLCNRFRKHFGWFALQYFFGLHIKSLIDLKIFVQLWELGGGSCPHHGGNFVVKCGGDSLMWNQYSHRADAKVKFCECRFPILFFRDVFKAVLITLCFSPQMI